MIKTLLLFIALLLGTQVALAEVTADLVGKYQLDVSDGDILELRADGTAQLAGDETRWSVKGKQLTVGTDVMSYSLQGDRLLLSMGNIKLNWKKIGGKTAALTPMQKSAAKARIDSVGRKAEGSGAGDAGGKQDAQARQLLTSTGWCSFSYNKNSGVTAKRKVYFLPDGVMTINSGSELYSSGQAGTYASQSANAGAMRWKFENLRLLIDQGQGGGYEDVGLTATRNSNGSIILHADGREYAMCK